MAQNITGTITGTVEDQTGARVIGASVTALNVEAGVAYRAKSSEAGVYVLPLLAVGKYQVIAQADGFKKFVANELALGADQRLRVDVRLELGSVTEEVKVTASSPLIQTDQSALSSSFSTADFENLPIGRSVTVPLELVPGILPDADGFATGNVNGTRERTTDVKVDGAESMLSNNGRFRMEPIQELVEEVVVQTSTYSAEFGKGGSQLSITTRAGTNEFHGALFYYFGNNVLNATSFINNLYGTARPQSRDNLFGGTIGGPVVLPKLYNGHNRTFFTFGYEGQRTRSYSLKVSSVPTVAMRAGDFSGQPLIYDPSTTRPNGAGFARDPFPSNKVPVALMDPVALKTLQIAYPLPTQSGIVQNYVRTGPNQGTHNAFNARLDHNFSERSRVTARYIYRADESISLMQFPGPAGAGANTVSENTDVYRYVLSGHYTYLIRPNLFNDAHFGLYRDRTPFSGPGTGEGWPAQLGLQNVAPDKFPLMTINQLTPFGGSNLATNRPGDNYEMSDSIMLAKGRHSLKVGVEYHALQNFTWQPGNSSGSFTFNTLPTMNPQNQQQGVGFASFLLGIPSTTALVLYPPDGFMNRFSYWGSYIQDDVRLSKRLVLNLGLRWEVTMPRTVDHNRQSNFDLQSLQLDLAGQNGYPDTIYDASWKQFGPRAGFAYTPFGNNRTVVRGGYGIFYAPQNSELGTFNTGPWNQSYSWSSLDSGITFPFTLRQGLPATSLNDPYVLSPLTATAWMARAWPSPYVQQWNLNIQRDAFAHTMVELGYVGSKGTRLLQSYQLNQVPGALLGPGNAQSRRPYPTRGDITASVDPAGNSTYHAFQARFQRRLSGGFSAKGAYTFAKSIDDFVGGNASFAYGITSAQDNHNLRLEKSVSGFDVTHFFSCALVYELPAGKGRRFLSRGGLADKVLGGWDLSALSTTESGRPLIMGTVTNLTGALGGGSRPNRLRNGELSGENRGRMHWFDASAYAIAGAFHFRQRFPH